MLDHQCILAMDIGGTFLKCALIQSGNKVVEGSFTQVEVDSAGTLQDAKSSYQKAISTMLKYARIKNMEIVGAGIDTPGPFDYTKGASMMDHKFAEMKGISLIPWYKEILGDVPIKFLSDSAAYLMGQIDRDDLRGYSRIGLVTIGTGLGFAGITDGKIMSTDIGGPAIVIYNKPYKEHTAEYYTTRKGIIKRYASEINSDHIDIDVKEIAELAKAGDKKAAKVFADEGVMLAEILSPIVDEYGFEAMIAGGQIAKAYGLFGAQLEKGLSRCPSLKLIKPAENFDTSALIGAAKALM